MAMVSLTLKYLKSEIVSLAIENRCFIFMPEMRCSNCENPFGASSFACNCHLNIGAFCSCKNFSMISFRQKYFQLSNIRNFEMHETIISQHL